MPILHSFYAWLLALAVYGTVDFQNYHLLHTNEQGFRFYLDETENFVINESVRNYLRAHTSNYGGFESIYGEPFVFGITLPDGQVVATIAGLLITGKYNGSKIDPLCSIGSLWVDEEYRHQGLGTFLITQVQHHAFDQGCKKMQLSTQEIDDSHGFFNKIGFDDVAVAPSPKSLKGHEIYWMRKNIHAAQMPVIDIFNKGYRLYKGYPFIGDTLWSLFQSNQFFDLYRVEKIFSNFVSSLIWTDESLQYIDYLESNLQKYRKSRGASQEVSDFTIFIVSPDDKIIGGAIGSVENFSDFGNWLNIHDVAIDEKYRKHQLGRELFKHVDAYALSKHCKYLELGSGESEAPKFYEKVGFIREVTLPGSLNPNNDPGNLLRKYLE